MFLQFYSQEYCEILLFSLNWHSAFIIAIIAVFSLALSLSSTISFVHSTHFSSTGNRKTIPATRQWRREKKSQHNFRMQKNVYHDTTVRANIVVISKRSFFSAAILRTCWSTTIVAGATNFWSVLSEDVWRDVSWLQ